MKDRVYTVMRINLISRFNTLLEKELREYVSDDVIYSHTYWNKNDKLTQEIYTVKDSIRDRIIENKYKKV